jgi:hypothetical protein
MSDRNTLPITDAFAYWYEGKLHVSLHGNTAGDDRRTELTPMQALKLAEQLTRAAREGLTAAAVTGLEYRGG